MKCAFSAIACFALPFTLSSPAPAHQVVIGDRSLIHGCGRRQSGRQGLTRVSLRFITMAMSPNVF